MIRSQVDPSEYDPTYALGSPFPIDDTEILAVDPGNIIPYTGVRLRNDGEFEVIKISKKWYNDKTLRRKVTKRAARRIRALRLGPIYAELESLKSSSWGSGGTDHDFRSAA